jgi:hypothetical protein
MRHPRDSGANSGILTRFKHIVLFLFGFLVATLAYSLMLGALPESTIGIASAGKGPNTIVFFLGYMLTAYLGGLATLWFWT